MRYREFNLTEDELFELKMSPTNLARMAKNIDARAGLEFELIMPDFFGEPDYDNVDPEPDYDMDERFPIGAGWRREVVNFFRGGDSPNSTGYIERQLADLEENFYGWFDDELENYLSSDEGQERGMEIAADNVSENDYDTTEEYQSALVAYIDDNSDDIREQLEQEYRDDLDSHWERYLEDENLTTMSEFGSAYNLDWPYWIYPEQDGGGADIDAIADDFGRAIGKPVETNRTYHGSGSPSMAKRTPGVYTVEPDSSLHGDRDEEGLEFVSPVLTVPEMLEDIDKVAKWANRIGAYTNDSTGLHMNVSVPDQQNLDYVKLAIFLGDNYILEQFGREGNTYCKSALEKIKSTARANPDRVDEMLRQFQGGLNQLASELIHTGSTEKFTSINNRGDWIEFRGPGGDWLGDDLELVKNTLLRTVVALDVACDPTAYKQEYYKKLYKTLSQGSQDTSIEYFAKYAAGELPKQALKSFIRQIQTKREVQKQAPGSGKQYWWRVSRPGFAGSIEVVAASQEEAIDKGTSGPDGYTSWQGRSDVRAEPLRPYEQEQNTGASHPEGRGRPHDPNGRYAIVSREDPAAYQTGRGTEPEYLFRFNMGDPEGQHNGRYILAAWAARNNVDPANYMVVDAERWNAPAAGGQQSSAVNYEIVDRGSDQVVFRFIANTTQEAVAKFNDWIRGTGEYGAGDTSALSRYSVRPIEGRPTSDPVPGSTEYLNRELTAQQDQAPGTGSLPEGNVRWRILDFDDNEVHSFINRPYQYQANQYALNWLRQNNMLGRGEFRVVPTQ